MEKLYEQTLLYDFYGDLLTEHQKKIYEEVVLDDSSLSEAAEEYGITRQGVHDMIRRINLNLEDYEKKLGLVAKFLDIKTKINTIKGLTENSEIQQIADEILHEL